MAIKTFCAAVAVSVSAACVLSAGVVPVSVNEYMNITSLGEAATSAFVSMGMARPTPGGQTLSWLGTYSDSGWTYSTSGFLDGLPLDLSYGGTLSGTSGHDIVVSFTGAGNWGSDPITIQGKTTWYYDAALNDYFRMDFQQLTEIGTHSLWGWVVGGEIVVGGGLGAAGGIVAGAPLSPAGSAVVGAAGALAGAGSAATLSEVIASVFSGDPAPPKPTTPTPPADPHTPQNIYPSEDRADSANSPDGRFVVQNTDVIRLQSSYAFGDISGTVTTVPEPHGFAWMIGVAILGLRRAIRRGAVA